MTGNHAIIILVAAQENWQYRVCRVTRPSKVLSEFKMNYWTAHAGVDSPKPYYGPVRTQRRLDSQFVSFAVGWLRRLVTTIIQSPGCFQSDCRSSTSSTKCSVNQPGHIQPRFGNCPRYICRRDRRRYNKVASWNTGVFIHHLYGAKMYAGEREYTGTAELVTVPVRISKYASFRLRDKRSAAAS